MGRSFPVALVFAIAGCTVLSGADRLSSSDVEEKTLAAGDGSTSRDAPAEEDGGPIPPVPDAAAEAEAGSPIPAGALVGRWAFDEGTGTAIADSSGKGHHGTATGGVWVAGRPGFPGSALELDGIAQHVFVPPHADFDRLAPAQLTMTVWARREQAMDHDQFFSVGWEDDANSYGIELRTSSLLSYFDGENHAAESSVTLPSGGWHHFAIVHDGPNVRIYFDGLRVGEGPAESTPHAAIGVMIGGSEWGDRFEGAIDEARYYRAALNDTQIAWDRDH